MAYRIGLASIDGTVIDQHFGSARYWQIYDLDTEAHFVECRKTVPKCQGHCEGGFEDLVSILEDCDAIFVLKLVSLQLLIYYLKAKEYLKGLGR